MSKYAKVIRGKVVASQQGLKPSGSDWLKVNVKWKAPTEYPSSFYSTSANIPSLKVEEGKVNEYLEFILKDLEDIKDTITDTQKEERQIKQLGSFPFGDGQIELKDREDSLIISSLAEVETKFKAGKRTWITLSPLEVKALKEAHRQHAQAAYDWEEAKNLEVEVLTTYEELALYVEAQ